MLETMLADRRGFAVTGPAIVALLVLGFATTVQAAPRLYSGSLIVEGFGNDTTNGAVAPFDDFGVLGVPLGIFCNKYYGTGKTTTNTLTVPTMYQIPCYSTYPSAQNGSPLTGGGTASLAGTGGLGPVTFTIPAAAGTAGLQRKLGSWFGLGQARGPFKPPGGKNVPGGSFSYYFPYIYSYSYADLKNKAGSFFGGGGPGSFVFSHVVGSAPVATVTQTAGPNQFGGTMSLLGFHRTVYNYFGVVGTELAEIDWRFDMVGRHGTATPTPTPPTVPRTETATGLVSVPGNATTHIFTGTGEAWGWTTGSVKVKAFGRGPFDTYMARSGYDNRTASGMGTIQLVTPLLTTWTDFTTATFYETGAIGVLKLTFVPEPGKSLMLAAGVSLLALLYGVQRRMR